MADRSGAPETRQAASAAASAPRAAWAAGAVALAGWALLALGGGGIDPGDGLGGPGPLAASLALALGAPLAGLVVVMAWDRAALRSGPARLALGACAAMTAWAALSMTWAAAPHLAWIDANRQAVALCALAVGVGLGALLPRAPLLLGLGLAAAALVPVGAALATKIFPEWLGADSDLARLSAPVGYWNALALVAVVAAPGAVWLAGARPGWRGGLPLAGAGLALVIVTVLLTYSRGGLLSLLTALVVVVCFAPATGRALAAVAAGAAGAALPAAYGLTESTLTADGLPTSQRADAGLVLGGLLLAGLAVAALLGPLLVRLAAGSRLSPRRAGRVVLVVLVVAAGAGAVVPVTRDWAGDRVAEFRGEGGDAVANDPARLVNPAGNQRSGWWGEAWRAFLDAPLTGQGAGGFALVHLQERETDDPALMTREPHGVVLRFLSGTGLIGTLLLAALAGAVVWAVLRAAAGERAPPEIGLPLAVMAAFVLQAAVDWSWAVPALTVPALAAAGVVVAAAAAPERQSVPGRRPGGGATAALTAVVLVAIAAAALPWWSTERVLAGEEALASGRAAEAVRRADQARAANPLAPEPLLLLARAHTDAGRRERALGAYLRATDVQPDNPATWRALALFLGDGRAAAAAWREVLRLDPRDLEAALRSG